MVVVDSSIWIEFFRGKDGLVVSELSRLLDADAVALAAPVRLELLSGASSKDGARLARLLSALPLWFPEPDLWGKLEQWIDRARRAGHRFGGMDLLIAGITADNGASLWSKDTDFVRLERLGLVVLHRV
jgi:predicted nucleic acid-binding protein